MAQFDESKVINALHPEKAEVGKMYWYSDNLKILKRYVEDNDTEYLGELKNVKGNDDVCIFQIHEEYPWEFLYPYEEPLKQRMTNRQLAEWLAKGNGEYTYMGSVFSRLSYDKEEDNLYVDECAYIRYWDSEEWIEPTIDIYERDCKGGEVEKWHSLMNQK